MIDIIMFIVFLPLLVMLVAVLAFFIFIMWAMFIRVSLEILGLHNLAGRLDHFMSKIFI